MIILEKERGREVHIFQISGWLLVLGGVMVGETKTTPADNFCVLVRQEFFLHKMKTTHPKNLIPILLSRQFC